jgi:hypothetical protein
MRQELRVDYPSRSWDYLEKKYNLSRERITQMAHLLGIKRSQHSRKLTHSMFAYSRSETSNIKHFFPEKPLYWLYFYLSDRDFGGIFQYAKRNSIKRTSEIPRLEIEEKKRQTLARVAVQSITKKRMQRVDYAALMRNDPQTLVPILHYYEWAWNKYSTDLIALSKKHISTSDIIDAESRRNAAEQLAMNAFQHAIEYVLGWSPDHVMDVARFYILNKSHF